MAHKPSSPAKNGDSDCSDRSRLRNRLTLQRHMTHQGLQRSLLAGAKPTRRLNGSRDIEVGHSLGGHRLEIANEEGKLSRLELTTTQCSYCLNWRPNLPIDGELGFGAMRELSTFSDGVTSSSFVPLLRTSSSAVHTPCPKSNICLLCSAEGTRWGGQEQQKVSLSSCRDASELSSFAQTVPCFA